MTDSDSVTRTFASLTAPPTVSVDDVDLDRNATATTTVTLSNVPNGLAGYELELEIEDSTIAVIESASYPDVFGLSKPPDLGSEGGTLRLKAADVDERVQAGASDIPLATILVKGQGAGQTNIVPHVIQMDDDQGVRLQPSVTSGSVTVGGTPSPTTTGGLAADYAYSEGTTRAVDLGWKTLYVVTEIPDADPSKWAVTDTDYNPVGTGPAFDALWSDLHVDVQYNIDTYRREIETSQEMRSFYRIEEFVSRAAEIGMNLLAAYALASTGAGAPAAVMITVDMLTDSIAWGQDALNKPYQNTFTKMANSGHNIRWLESNLAGVRRSSAFTKDTEQFIDTSVQLLGHLQNAEDVYTAWRTFFRGISNSELSGLFYRGATIQAANFFAGLFIDLTSEALENWFRQNAKIAGLLHAYHTCRIPTLEQLIRYEQLAKAGRLAPPEILRYYTHRFVYDQMGALAHDQVARFYKAMVDDPFDISSPQDLTKLIDEPLEILQNPGEKAATHYTKAEHYRQAAIWDFVSIGGGVRDAQDRLVNSINFQVANSGGDQ